MDRGADRTAAAIPILERAVALRERDPGAPTALAESRFALATLATQARDAYRTAGKSFTKQVAEIEAWQR